MTDPEEALKDAEQKEEQAANEKFAEVLQGWSGAFDELCQERHEAGAKEYGQFTFLGNDIIRMMMEELADTANYCRMQFIKLMFLQSQLEGDERFVQSDMGGQAFKGVGEVGWKQ